jgi:hypothetical protein
MPIHFREPIWQSRDVLTTMEMQSLLLERISPSPFVM